MKAIRFEEVPLHYPFMDQFNSLTFIKNTHETGVLVMKDGLQHKPFDRNSVVLIHAIYDHVFCSQCGGKFGASNHGYSHCDNHKYRRNLDE